MTSLHYILTTLLIILTTAFLRLLYVLPATHRRRPSPRKRGTPTHLLIVLGSGGHTAEMLSLLWGLDTVSYTHRSYIVSSGDDFSADRAVDFEGSLAGKDVGTDVGRDVVGKVGQGYSIHMVPRARRIHQSLLSSPITSFRCLYACLKVLYYHPEGYPDLILTNGPATSLILILASTILRYFAFLPFVSRLQPSETHAKASGNMRVIYVESWARVKRPSLSGRIIVWYGLGDRVLVQWKDLEARGWGEFRGVLVR